MSQSAALTPDLLIKAYARGLFPMVHEDGVLYWHDPDPRAVFPLEALAPNARLARFIRNSGYTITHDQAFEQVIRACGDRGSSWLDATMMAAYTALHRLGHARSVETWHNGELIGGIYGVALGRAFFGESMFSHATNASKAAFYALADLLRQQGYELFDTQYANAHTRSLGAIEIPRDLFQEKLTAALAGTPAER